MTLSWTKASPPLTEIVAGHSLHQSVVDDFVQMKTAAKQDNINIDIVSAFRSPERQLVIWNGKWRGEKPLFSRSGDLLDAATLNDSEKLEAILTWSALPGASRHHWGTDFDVFDKKAVDASGIDFQLVPEEYEKDGPCQPLSHWLRSNIANFGFTLPYAQDKGGIAQEPWHLSHANTANQFENELSIASLEQFISDIDIEGKEAILQNLAWIYPRFVLNEGNQD